MGLSLNRAQIIGNLTRDPEVRQTPTGQSVVSFGVATNFSWKDQSGERQSKVEFHNIVAWRRLAEICGQYLRKGSKVFIEGRLQTRDWEGEDGVRRYRTEIVADNMIMLGGRGEGMESGAPGMASEGLSVPPVEGAESASEAPAEGSDLKEFDDVAAGQEKGSLKKKAGAKAAGTADAKAAKPTKAKSTAKAGSKADDEDEIEIDDLPF